MKGIGIFIVSLLAVIGGAAFAALLIKKKLKREAEVDFDEDYPLHDDDFEEFYDDDFEDDAQSDESDSADVEEAEGDTADDDSDDFDDALMQAADAAHDIAKDDDTDVFSGIVFDDIIEEDDAEKPNESI